MYLLLFIISLCIMFLISYTTLLIGGDYNRSG